MTAITEHSATKMTQEQLYPLAYRHMYRSKTLDKFIGELFKKGYVKGTVTSGAGNEATAIGMGFPFESGKDVLSILHRDIGTHLLMGESPYKILCQFMANADSITHAREGNIHFGNAAQRRFPMMSHLGSMLSLVVGGVWGARQNGEKVCGLAVIGDGGTSTGDFHEAINIAAVRNVPVLFVIENNEYAFSTPVKQQFACAKLSSRAEGYGIRGTTIDGTDVWKVYSTVFDIVQRMKETGKPEILESLTLRLEGHAVYDQAKYVTNEENIRWAKKEPVALTRSKLLEAGFMSEDEVLTLEKSIDAEMEEAVHKALKAARPSPNTKPLEVFKKSEHTTASPFSTEKAHNFKAINLALEYILSNNKNSALLGLDIGPYGSAFKTCKGLYEKFGPEKVLDMPICESGITGFSLGASQTGALPIVEFQFADFGTEAVTNLGLNCGTWFFRSDNNAQLLFRFPCAGGITLGAFHSGEFEGLWSRFPGLKLLYPVTPQETFEAIVAGFYDPNPCLIFENKYLYTRNKGDISFDGNLDKIWRPRRYTEGTDVTIIAFGSMIELALKAAKNANIQADIWNPFILNPIAFEPLYQSVQKTGKLLVIQESTQTGGLGDLFISRITRNVFSSLKCAPQLISSKDLPVPFAPELENFYRPNLATITNELNSLMENTCE